MKVQAHPGLLNEILSRKQDECFLEFVIFTRTPWCTFLSLCKCDFSSYMELKKLLKQVGRPWACWWSQFLLLLQSRMEMFWLLSLIWVTIVINPSLSGEDVFVCSPQEKRLLPHHCPLESSFCPCESNFRSCMPWYWLWEEEMHSCDTVQTHNSSFETLVSHSNTYGHSLKGFYLN